MAASPCTPSSLHCAYAPPVLGRACDVARSPALRRAEWLCGPLPGPPAGLASYPLLAGIIATTGFFSGLAKSIRFPNASIQDGAPGHYGIGFPNFLGTATGLAAQASELHAELANGH